MAGSKSAFAPGSLRRRLLSDIAEIQQNPYPNVHLHFDDANIRKACLILTPENAWPLHLTLTFPQEYPLRAPEVTIQSRILHPNVFGDYICASMLNTEEGWTAAYTLKGVVIQLLSFFCSESLEQVSWYDGHVENLEQYRSHAYNKYWDEYLNHDDFECKECGFWPEWTPPKVQSNVESVTESVRNLRVSRANKKAASLSTLPDEVVLLILAALDARDVLVLADAVPFIKTMVYSYNMIRIMELQCFCLKKSFREAKLGIGISITGGRRPFLRSEFELLSQEAFFQYDMRKSVQGVEFSKWLPLPLNRHHWNRVKGNVMPCLKAIHDEAKLNKKGPGNVDVLYHLMNTIVVQFSADAERDLKRSDKRSTLNHASEKAVESYFGLFHLLLCLATEDPNIVQAANRTVSRFLAGPRGKTQFPDLGHVLVAALIADCGLTQDLIFKVVKEAILRNVVWMLDSKGAGMAELAYLEPDAISNYRLVMTFHASRTSYRLLMFLRLFSATARRPGKTLVQLRDELFDTHGAPPAKTVRMMATRIRQIRLVDGFPGFLSAMGITTIPSKTEFTTFLRRTITDSVAARYSRIPMSQSELYMIRRAREPRVQLVEGVRVTPGLEKWFARGEKWYDNGWAQRPSFFPEQMVRKEKEGTRRGR